MNALKRVLPLALLLAAAVAFWFLFSPEPAIVRDLRSMQEVGQIESTGPDKPTLTVLHICNLHWIPEEFAAGHVYPSLLRHLDKVQNVQMAIVGRLIYRHKVQTIYCEGFSKADLPSLKASIDALREIGSTLRNLDAVEDAQARELTRSIGIPGRLLMSKELEVLPLDGGDGKKDAIPKDFPKSGLAVVFAGGDHDLRPHLPASTLYVRVKSKSYQQ